MRENIAAAVQGHVALGLATKDAKDARRGAHARIQGYGIVLGKGNGAGLSGGQKQRLAIARARFIYADRLTICYKGVKEPRARLRNPAVLFPASVFYIILSPPY